MVAQIGKTPLTGMSYRAKLAQQLDGHLPVKRTGPQDGAVVRADLIEKVRDELKQP